MKKTLLALAIFAGAAHAADTTTLYGRVGYGVEVQKDRAKDVINVKNTRTSLDTDAVRIGIKGKEDVVDGLDAIYQIELGFDFGKNEAEIDTDSNGKLITTGKGVKNTKGHLHEVRQAWVGLQGENFGTLKFGKQSSIYDSFTGKADQFKKVSGEFRNGTSRLGKAISYATPSLGGVTVAVAGVLDGHNEIVTTSEKKNFTAYEAGAEFNWNGIEIGTAYQKLDGDKSGPKGSVEFLSASAGYNHEIGEFFFDYDHKSSEYDAYAVTGAFKHGKNTVRLGGEYLNRDGKGNDGKDRYNILAGYQFQLTPRTVSWIEGKYTKDKQRDSNNKDFSGYTTNVGIRHDF